MCVTLEPGEGHADQPTSRDVVERFGVTERDMPPWRIIDAARRAGFTGFEIFQRTPDPVPAPAESPAARLRRAIAAWRADPAGPPPSVDTTRITGIVRLRR